MRPGRPALSWLIVIIIQISYLSGAGWRRRGRTSQTSNSLLAETMSLGARPGYTASSQTFLPRLHHDYTQTADQNMERTDETRFLSFINILSQLNMP